MAEFVSVGPAEEGAAEARRSDVVLAAAEKSFEQAKWWARFKEELEIGGIRMPAVHILVVDRASRPSSACGSLPCWAARSLFGLLALGHPVRRPRADQAQARAAASACFAEQLPDNLQVLASALRAGHSLVGALSVVVDDCPEPSRSEFRRVVADEQLGVPLEDAFGVVARRMENSDLEQVALVAALQRETGGNTAEVLDRVAETIRAALRAPAHW